MQNRIAIVLHNVEKALHYEWVAASLLASGYTPEFVLLGKQPGALGSFLSENGIAWVFYPQQHKWQLALNCLRLTCRWLRQRPTAVHTHLLEGGLVGLLVAWALRIPVRLHTRHHSDMQHRYSPGGVKYDRLCNWLATRVVAISPVVAQVLLTQEQVPAEKVRLLPHGFELSAFARPAPHRIAAVRKRWELPADQGPVVGCIAKWIPLKGVAYVVRAFAQLLTRLPTARLVLAGGGSPNPTIVYLLHEQLPPNSWHCVDFEPDIAALYATFDAFVHTPIGPTVEAFGQIYIEALAAGVPAVFTLSGIAHQCIRHEANALVVPYEDSTAIAEALHRILTDAPLAAQLVAQGQIDAEAYGWDAHWASYLSLLQTEIAAAYQLPLPQPH